MGGEERKQGSRKRRRGRSHLEGSAMLRGKVWNISSSDSLQKRNKRSRNGSEQVRV